MFIRHFTHVFCSLGVGVFISGCGGAESTPSNSTAVSSNRDSEHHEQDDHKHADTAQGHRHERGKMLIADAGPCHALLTAHLAEAGNELDVFLETPVDKDPQPLTIADKPFEAQATTGDGDSQPLTFEPAPAAERPAGEKAGVCSHFVAKAAWMKPDDDLLVVARFTIDGQDVVARWKKFVPKTFAHHVE